MKLCKGETCKRRKQAIKRKCCADCEPTIYAKCKNKCTYFKGSSVSACPGLEVVI